MYLTCMSSKICKFISLEIISNTTDKPLYWHFRLSAIKREGEGVWILNVTVFHYNDPIMRLFHYFADGARLPSCAQSWMSAHPYTLTLAAAGLSPLVVHFPRVKSNTNFDRSKQKQMLMQYRRWTLVLKSNTCYTSPPFEFNPTSAKSIFNLITHRWTSILPQWTWLESLVDRIISCNSSPS